MIFPTLEFELRDRVWRDNDNKPYSGEIVGWCVGEDGRDCLVCRNDKMRGVYLLPVEEAVSVKSLDDVLRDFAYDVGQDGWDWATDGEKYVKLIKGAVLYGA